MATYLPAPIPLPTTTPTKPPLTVAIIGAGIAGLTTALSLHHHSPHHHVTIYESTSRFGEIGAGVNFSSNAARAMHLIAPALLSAFARARTTNSLPRAWMQFCAAASEAPLVLVEDETGGPRGGLKRADFLDELLALLPADTKARTRFGKRLVGLQGLPGGAGMELQFADGTTATHDAVVGCDGIKSRTRRLVLGEADPAARAVYSGQYCYRGLVSIEEAVRVLGEQRARNSHLYIGDRRHVVTYPVAGGSMLNFAAFATSETWDSEEWVVPAASGEAVSREFEGLGPRLRALLQLVERPDIWALFDHLPARTYCIGHVVLVGDAAHSSTPHQGAGAGMAVEDALVLGRLLGRVKEAGELEAAFAAFDHVRRPRTQKVVRTSREAGEMYAFGAAGVGDDMGKICESLSKRMGWIWYHDHEAEIEEARRFFEERVG